MRSTVPAPILALGHARAAARRARDFDEADRLRAEIEAAGYTVVDRGTDFVLSPAHPPDLVEGGVTRYGWSGAVPSRLGEPPSATASVVLVADAGTDPLRRTLAGLRSHAPAGTQAIVVVPPDTDLDGAPDAGGLLAPVGGLPTELVRLAVPCRPAAARNAGMRRAVGGFVVWVGCGATVAGDVVSPLVAALADPSVAVAGAVGLAGDDVRQLTRVTDGEATVIEAGVLAFRRDDLVALGPLDERLFGDEELERWWSLVLRSGPPGGVAPPRRAVVVALPVDLATAATAPPQPLDPVEAARRRKRDRYRLIDLANARPDLLRGPRSRA